VKIQNGALPPKEKTFVGDWRNAGTSCDRKRDATSKGNLYRGGNTSEKGLQTAKLLVVKIGIKNFGRCSSKI